MLVAQSDGDEWAPVDRRHLAMGSALPSITTTTQPQRLPVSLDDAYNDAPACQQPANLPTDADRVGARLYAPRPQ
jgi:hypothetical protein